MSDFEVLERILTGRFSCRGYLDTPIDRAEIEQVLRAAQRVPSWCNAQPWQVVVTAPGETARLANALTEQAMTVTATPDLPFPKGYTGAHKERRRTCGWQLYEAMGVSKGDRDGSAREMIKNYRFFGAPHVAVITSGAELGPYGALDCGGFITGFTLAAQSKGIATIAQAAPAAFAPFLRAWFGLGEDRLVLATIAFGRADPEHPANGFRTERAPLTEWVDFRE
ncbi:MAG: nitroreductase family protein [Maritimibacter sp.]